MSALLRNKCKGIGLGRLPTFASRTSLCRTFLTRSEKMATVSFSKMKYLSCAVQKHDSLRSWPSFAEKHQRTNVMHNGRNFMDWRNFSWVNNDKGFQYFMASKMSRNPDNSEQKNNEENQQENQQNPGEDQNQFTWGRILFLGLIGALYLFTSSIDPVPETSWPAFKREMLAAGEVTRLDVVPSGDKVYVYLEKGAMVNGREFFGPGPHYSFGISSVDNFEDKLSTAQKDLAIKPEDFIPVKYRKENDLFNTFLATLGTIAIIGGIFYLLLGRRGASGGSKQSFGGNPFGNYMKAKATVIEPGTRKGIGFKDVAGMAEAKQEIVEFVDYLKDSQRFTDLGAKIPKGALLVGPPGTGKTLLAKAVATEAAVPFLTMAGSDFVEMFAGVGSARVRDLFGQARKKSPCIIYIDEIDAIGKSRRSSANVGGNSEQENTLNQLLVEMDGINTIEGVVILASTNRPDILDQALLRPGRFDRLVAIDLPTLPERKDIFDLYLRKLKLEKSVSFYSKRLAELTPGKSGADIANICNEAALHAARVESKKIGQTNFEYAVERIIAGMEKKSNPLSPEERKIIAYHEAGHALVGWMLEHTEPVLKISIAPRTNSVLGYTQQLPLDIKLFTTNQLFDRMCMALGGRVAEASTFHRITTGAEDDLRRVTEMAYQQIVTYGMNERIGPISFPLKKNSDFAKKPYSDKLARMIDEEASKLVKKAYDYTGIVVKDNEHKLEKLASRLLAKEVLNYNDLVEILGNAPYGDKRQFFKEEASGTGSPLMT